MTTLRTRRLRPVAAAASTSSAMPANFLSRQGLQKWCPAAVPRKWGSLLSLLACDVATRRGDIVQPFRLWQHLKGVVVCSHPAPDMLLLLLL